MEDSTQNPVEVDENGNPVAKPVVEETAASAPEEAPSA